MSDQDAALAYGQICIEKAMHYIRSRDVRRDEREEIGAIAGAEPRRLSNTQMFAYNVLRYAI